MRAPILYRAAAVLLLLFATGTYWDFFVGAGFTVGVLYLFSAVLAWQLGGHPRWRTLQLHLCGARCAMTALAVALAFCAALGAQATDDLDRLFRMHQWFELRSAVTDRSAPLMRAAVATAFNDPETAERLLRDIIKSARASNAADEAYGMLSQIYLRSGQYRRWLTSYRQWVAAIPDSARARAQEEDEKKLAGRPDQVNGGLRHAVLRHDPGDLTIPVSVGGKVNDFLFDTGAWTSVLSERMAARLGLKIDATRRMIMGRPGNPPASARRSRKRSTSAAPGSATCRSR